MLNIKKIDGGFLMRGLEYYFDGNSYEIISDSQVSIPTDRGFIWLDLSVTIDGGSSYTNLNDLIYNLYN